MKTWITCWNENQHSECIFTIFSTQWNKLKHSKGVLFSIYRHFTKSEFLVLTIMPLFMYIVVKQCPVAAKIAGSNVWTSARFMLSILATVLCVWEIWSGSNNSVYMYHVFQWLAKKRFKKKKKKRKKTFLLLNFNVNCDIYSKYAYSLCNNLTVLKKEHLREVV